MPLWPRRRRLGGQGTAAAEPASETARTNSLGIRRETARTTELICGAKSH